MDYKNGKVYKITDLNYTKQYIGSTTQPLYKRLSVHKSHYKKIIKDQNNYRAITSTLLFDEFGVDNCIIILIENCPCENREQLLMRENYYIKNEECVNKYLSYRTEEEKQEYNKKYLTDHKEDLKLKKKEWHKNNKDKQNEKARKYHEDHKAEINERHRKTRELKKASVEI